MWTNQRLKALISAKAKKFIASEPTYYLLQTFTSKAHNNLQGVFPTMIGIVTLGHLFASSLNNCKKVAKGDNANHGWENTL